MFHRNILMDLDPTIIYPVNITGCKTLREQEGKYKIYGIEAFNDKADYTSYSSDFKTNHYEAVLFG